MLGLGLGLVYDRGWVGSSRRDQLHGHGPRFVIMDVRAVGFDVPILTYPVPHSSY